MKKINYILLISPPGGGKSTWLQNYHYDIKIDDMSINPNAIEDLSNSIASLKKSVTIAIADVNLCDYSILQKAWNKLSQIAKDNQFDNTFEHILFVGTKDEYLKNVDKRNDGRNVYATIVRFAPHILKLQKQNFTNKNIVYINSYHETVKVKP